MPSDAEIDAMIERLKDVAGFVQKEHGRVAAASCLATEAAAFLAALRDDRDQYKTAFADGYDAAKDEYRARVRELEQKLERARVALEPFGQAANDAEEFAGHDGPLGQYIEFKQLRRARATLAEIGQRE